MQKRPAASGPRTFHAAIFCLEKVIGSHGKMACRMDDTMPATSVVVRILKFEQGQLLRLLQRQAKGLQRQLYLQARL